MSANHYTLQDLRSSLRSLLETWKERAAERRARGEMGGAILYLTVYNELLNELDRVAPARLSAPVGAFLTPVDYRRPIPLWALAKERRSARQDLLQHFEPGEPIAFTCDECPHARACKLAFDLYNTDGDCLAEK